MAEICYSETNAGLSWTLLRSGRPKQNSVEFWPFPSTIRLNDRPQPVLKASSIMPKTFYFKDFLHACTRYRKIIPLTMAHCIKALVKKIYDGLGTSVPRHIGIIWLFKTCVKYCQPNELVSKCHLIFQEHRPLSAVQLRCVWVWPVQPYGFIWLRSCYVGS